MVTSVKIVMASIAQSGGVVKGPGCIAKDDDEARPNKTKIVVLGLASSPVLAVPAAG
jgi:hypothetical protein